MPRSSVPSPRRSPGNGEFKTAAVEVPWEKIVAEKWAKGLKANLYFSEKIDGTESTKAWDGKELLPNETVPVEKPSIVTKASENGTVPLVAHDIGIVSGTIPSGTGIKVTTKVNQYKFDDSTDGSAQAVCANPSWSSPDQDVTGAGEITYPSHTIAHKGTYGYVEELKLTIDKGEGKEPFTAQLHKGNCGEKNETVIAFPEAVTVSPDQAGPDGQHRIRAHHRHGAGNRAEHAAANHRRHRLRTGTPRRSRAVVPQTLRQPRS